MNYQILDFYSDYLLSSFGQTTATGLARLVDGQISHNQITRMLGSEKLTSQTWWKRGKPSTYLSPLIDKPKPVDKIPVF